MVLVLPRLKRLILSYIQIRLISFFGFAVSKKYSKYDISYSDLIVTSGIFPKQNTINWNLISKEWSKSFELHNQGHFGLANKKREKILEEVYSFHDLTGEYVPPLLGNEFFGAIGHNAISGIFLAAQSLNLIPNEKRTAIISPNMAKNNQISLYKNQINFIHDASGGKWTELPSLWHLSERHSIVRGKVGFVNIYDLIDQVFNKCKVTAGNSFFKLDQELISNLQRKLYEFGVKEQDWFVGLHIRDGSSTPSLRNQSLENYIPAINEITRRGGWVIRIGDNSMRPLPNLPRVIDLVKEPNAEKDLHLYVIAKSKFFITTNSGPLYFPSIFGVPTISTNLIGIGRTTFPLALNSIHLPKTYIKSDGSKASLAETLHSPFGFGELTLEEYARQGIFVQENSSSQILASTIEMFERLEGNSFSDETHLDSLVNQIRSQFDWTSSGKFSTTFLRNNYDWFLS